MNSNISRLLLLLFSVLVACLAYFTLFDHAMIKDGLTGKILFGYDQQSSRFYFNEYPPTLKKSDGPYILYKGGMAVITRSFAGENEFHVESNILSLSDLFEQGIRVAADSSASFYVDIQREVKAPASSYTMPDHLLAFSDIEGNFNALKRLLLEHKVMDREFNWIFGKGHLVLLGDFMDRGEEVIPCLWLIYRLEQLAKIHQGQVHFILGNHEQMNLLGDSRYTAPKYNALSEAIKIPYHDLFSEGTELGRWLRSKNCIEKIGHTLFVHGGVSKEVAGLNLSPDQINTIARYNLTKSDLSDGIAATILHHQKGLLWYRGWIKPYKSEDKLTLLQANEILQKMNAKHIVVGHTTVSSISTDYNNQLVRLNAEQLTAANKSTTHALLIEKEKWYTATNPTTKTLLFTEQ